MSRLAFKLRQLADDIEESESRDVVKDLRAMNDSLRAELRSKDREIEKLRGEVNARTRRPSEFRQHTEEMRKEYAENEGGRSL